MSLTMNATAGPSCFPGSLSSDAHGEFFFSASFSFRKLLIYFTFTEIDSSRTTTKKRKRIDYSTENVTRCSRGVRVDYRLLNDPFLSSDLDLSSTRSKKRTCLRSMRDNESISSSSPQIHSILPRPRTSNVSIQSSTPKSTFSFFSFSYHSCSSSPFFSVLHYVLRQLFFLQNRLLPPITFYLSLYIAMLNRWTPYPSVP
jgi:hypothetical protein